MHSFFTLFKTKQFYIHLAIVITIIVLIIFFTLKWLASFTNHGKYVLVPDFKGRRITELSNFVQGKDISYQIIDSIYDPREKSGIVLRQDPEMNTKVKHNRTVYLYVTGMVPPQVRMPRLIDRSERQARLIINSYGLRVGRVEEKKADCNGCVLDQLLKGAPVAEGKGVPKGSVIDLVVGRKDAFYNSGTDTTTIIPEEEEPNFN